MAPRPFTPPELMVGPFLRRDGLSAGLTPEQLRSACWRRLFHTVYLHRSVRLTDEVRLAAVRLISPDHAVVAGLTAAWLYGVWTPAPGQVVPLHLATASGSPKFTTGGMRNGRMVVDLADVDEFHGVPIISPIRTCFGLMTKTSLTEAVVWADSFLHKGLICAGALGRYADERPHWPYVRMIRLASSLARPGAASPMESRLRMVVVLGGLPEPPFLNVAIYDEDGNLLGIVDMHYDIPYFGMEYDGAQHAEPEHHVADLVRENKLLTVGQMPLLRYSARDVFGAPQRIVAEVGTMLRRAS